MEFLVLILAYLFALVATSLFFFGLWRVIRTFAIVERLAQFLRELGLSREPTNPILVPRSDLRWEEGGVMNPAAVEAGGKVHLFYRAVGGDGVSRIGYAASTDGMKVDEQLPYPVFAMEGVDGGDAAHREMMRRRFPELVASGGSWGGVEDPRTVIIDDRMYLSFSAFYNWSSLRIGVSSIKVSDLLNKRWKWSPPVFLSPSNAVRKNWVLFPEKINGKFALLHAFKHNDRNTALVEYLDSLDHDPDPSIEGDPRFRNDADPNAWDTWVRSPGPPPVKTKDGWLVLYHANDKREPHKYKLGAMLLDKNDPTKVIARSPGPILSPDEWYENEGKEGIVYACGALIRNGDLHVYYGGGDRVVCAAKTPLAKLTKKLETVDARHLSKPLPSFG